MKVALTAVVLLITGCKVGEPVVDREPKMAPTEYGAIIIACRMPGPCADEPEDIVTKMTALRSLHWIGCANGAGEGAALDPLGDDSGSDSEAIDELDGDHNCSALRFVADDGSEQLVLNGVSWTKSDIAIEAVEPLEIVLNRSHVVDVRIDLRGPVTLRFADQTEVMATGISSASSASLLGLDHITAVELTVGDAANPFMGALEARHADLQQPSMSVASTDFDSVAIEEGYFVTDRLESRDGFIRDLVLELGIGLFAPSELELVDIRRCTDLSFFGSRVTNTQIAACTDQPTRIYTSTVVRSSLDGTLSADSSRLESDRFGEREPTTLLAWGTDVRLSKFCDFITDAKIEQGSICNVCSDAFNERAEVCKLPQGVATGSFEQDNFCQALDAAEVCAPEPVRPRPSINGANDE